MRRARSAISWRLACAKGSGHGNLVKDATVYRGLVSRRVDWTVAHAVWISELRTPNAASSAKAKKPCPDLFARHRTDVM
jgi:hypothetical protein